MLFVLYIHIFIATCLMQLYLAKIRKSFQTINVFTQIYTLFNKTCNFSTRMQSFMFLFTTDKLPTNYRQTTDTAYDIITDNSSDTTGDNYNICVVFCVVFSTLFPTLFSVVHRICVVSCISLKCLFDFS